LPEAAVDLQKDWLIGIAHDPELGLLSLLAQCLIPMLRHFPGSTLPTYGAKTFQNSGVC
jgi:hypothetical protein